MNDKPIIRSVELRVKTVKSDLAIGVHDPHDFAPLKRELVVTLSDGGVLTGDYREPEMPHEASVDLMRWLVSEGQRILDEHNAAMSRQEERVQRVYAEIDGLIPPAINDYMSAFTVHFTWRELRFSKTYNKVEVLEKVHWYRGDVLNRNLQLIADFCRLDAARWLVEKFTQLVEEWETL